MAAAVHICVTSYARQHQRQMRRNVVGGCGASSHFSSGSGNSLMLPIYCAWAMLRLLAASAAMVQSAAVSFGDLLVRPTFKPLCSAQQEHFIESDGKESSLIIELKPGVYGSQHTSCSRILSAPANFGFIVRLILPKLLHQQPNAGSTTTTVKPPSDTLALSKKTTFIDRLNMTSASIRGRTCPLNIFSSLDPHTPQWRVDPCQLEDTAPEMEDPVRLFHGRVRIVWEHGHHALKSKLMITVLGKGDQCNDKSKHQCLKIGNEPILCISKELTCDGIRHCPYSNEYDSDEDYDLCFKSRRPGRPLPSALESDLFEQFALEVFRNLFAYDAPTVQEDLPLNFSSMAENEGALSNTTMLRKVHDKDMKKHSVVNSSTNTISEEQGDEHQQISNSTVDGGVGNNFSRRNSTRSGLHSDLSKYGPWGYLMLGMLLCGGALLICGLWASASQHAVNNERDAALAAVSSGSNADQTNAHITSPPNYEELDPPPAYSVLFPNQKAASSNTQMAVDTSPTSLPLSPGRPTATSVSAAARSDGTITIFAAEELSLNLTTAT